jgi:hypothetical protein
VRGGEASQDTAHENARHSPGQSVKIMLARAELHPSVSGDMTAADKALHDELCKVDGGKAKQ